MEIVLLNCKVIKPNLSIKWEIETENRRRMIYKKIVVWFVESLLAIFTFATKHYEVSICIFMADIVMCISLVVVPLRD